MKWKNKIPTATKEKAASFTGIATNSSSLCTWWQWWDVSAIPEKRSQGKTKAELDEGKARCWKILWPLTVQSREGNVHREAHETTFCTSQLLHTSAPLTHQHTWTILLALDVPPDALTASGFKKNLNRNLLHCRNKARALPLDCKSSRTWCALQQMSQ